MRRFAVGLAFGAFLFGWVARCTADDFLIAEVGSKPTVASLKRGFVVVWEGIGDGWDIFGRLYGPGGEPMGPTFRINTYTKDFQLMPTLTPLAGGGFLVTWSSDGSAGSDQSSYSVQARLFGASGEPATPQFQVNSLVSGVQLSSGAASAADGSFAIAWTSTVSGGSDSDLSVQARLFSPFGVAKGPEFQVNTITDGSQGDPAVAMAPDGRFLVAWTNGQPLTTFAEIDGQLFDAQGRLVGPEFQINTFEQDAQEGAVAVMTRDGNYMVAWTSTGSGEPGDSDYSVKGQRVGYDGSLLGPEIQINTHTAGHQYYQSLAALPAGGFVAAWASQHTDFDSIQARDFATGGEPRGAEFQVNTGNRGQLAFTGLAAGEDGISFAVWAVVPGEVRGRLFHGRTVFEDGFESGDTSAWSHTVP